MRMRIVNQRGGRRNYWSKSSVVRGHHVYKAIWMPHVGQYLQLSCEEDNKHDDLRGRLHDTEFFPREKNLGVVTRVGRSDSILRE